MNGRTCVLCRGPVDLAGSINHKSCPHRSHGLCLQNHKDETGHEIDWHKCPACLDQVDLNAPVIPVNTPQNYNGRDYIVNPPTRQSIFSRVKKATVNWTNVDKEDTEDMTYLIAQGPQECPVDWLLRTKDNMSIHRIIHDGVTLDDFINAGYCWDDLMIFPEIYNGGERSIKALAALGCDATHFRDCLSFDEVKKDTGNVLWARHMVEQFGLHFPSVGDDFGMRVVQRPKDDRQWTADHLVEFGFDSMDLEGAGMEYYEQYEALCPTEEEERKLLGNPLQRDTFLDSLIDAINAPQEETPVAPVAPMQIKPIKSLKPIQRRGGFGHGLRKNRRK